MSRTVEEGVFNGRMSLESVLPWTRPTCDVFSVEESILWETKVISPVYAQTSRPHSNYPQTRSPPSPKCDRGDSRDQVSLRNRDGFHVRWFMHTSYVLHLKESILGSDHTFFRVSVGVLSSGKTRSTFSYSLSLAHRLIYLEVLLSCSSRLSTVASKLLLM